MVHNAPTNLRPQHPSCLPPFPSNPLVLPSNPLWLSSLPRGGKFEPCLGEIMNIKISGETLRKNPCKTDFIDGYRIKKLFEVLNLFADLCPDDSSNITLCSEGLSFAPLLKNLSMPWKKAIFSQYPR